MNKEIKKRWIEALRSGEYKQGKGRLCALNEDNTYSYCCLGVLADLRLKESLDGDNKEGIMFYTFLPSDVVEWCKIGNVDPYINFKEERRSLALINDGNPGLYIEPHTFNEIADLIEADESL